MPESGEPTTIEECPKCGRKPCHGVSWFDDADGWHFKCDECGKRHFLGYAEADNQAMVDAKRAYERAKENRERYMREKDEQMQGVYAKAREALDREPDVMESYSFLFDPAAAVQGKKVGWESDGDTLQDKPDKSFTKHVS